MCDAIAELLGETDLSLRRSRLCLSQSIFAARVVPLATSELRHTDQPPFSR